MEIMKLIGSNKSGKTVNLERVDLQLTISEIDKLIDFFKACKKDFNSRQQDCSIKRIVMKNDEVNYEVFTTYRDVKAIGSEIIDCELHYVDWCNDKKRLFVDKDIVIHTPFKAKKKEDGSFTWENIDG